MDPAVRVFGASLPLLFLPAEYLGGNTGIAPLDYFINLFGSNPDAAVALPGLLQAQNPALAGAVQEWGSAIQNGDQIVVTGNNIPTAMDLVALEAATKVAIEPAAPLQETASFRPDLSLSGETAEGEFSDLNFTAVEPEPETKQSWEMTRAEWESEYEYHGGPEEIRDGLLERHQIGGTQDSGGIFTTPSEEYATNFPRTKHVYGVRVSDKNILDLRTPPERDALVGQTYQDIDGEQVTFTEQDYEFVFPGGEGGDWATVPGYEGLWKQMGYDAVRIYEEHGDDSITTTVFFEGGLEVHPTHRQAVQQALAEGLPVPVEVLVAYPDLVEAPSWEIKENLRGAHDGQTDVTLYIDGVGRLDYSDFQGEILIEMIDVEPEYRRQGVATALMEHLQAEYPGAVIRWGMVTEEGEALRQALFPEDAEVIATKEVTRQPWEMTRKEHVGYTHAEINAMLGEHPDDTPEHQAAADLWMDVIRPKEREYMDSVRAAVSAGKLTLEEGLERVESGSYVFDFLKPIPDGTTLYHVTVGLPGVQEQGLLLHKDVLAQGGSEGIGGTSDTISFTTNKEYAEHVVSGLQTARDVALGRISMADVLAQAEEIKPGITQEVQDYAATRNGITEDEFEQLISGDNDVVIQHKKYGYRDELVTLDTQEERWALFKSLNAFIGGAQYIAIWGYPGADKLANWHIGLVEAISVPGAHGEYVTAEEEWRVFSPEAVEIQGTEDRETQPLGSGYLGRFAIVGVRPWKGPGCDPAHQIFGTAVRS